MYSKTDIEALIIRSFSETLTAAERQQLIEWIKTSENNKTEYLRLKNLWQVSAPVFDPDSIDVDKAEATIFSIISKRKWFQAPVFVWWQRVAAVIVLPLTLFVLFTLLSNNRLHNPVAYQEIYSPVGITSCINLPDGSKVWLNSGSKLTYPVAFDDDERHVSLRGEGFFEVQSDKKHPFIVETNLIKVKATGTRFNVEAYPSDSITAITLLHGKVNVKGNGVEQDMIPNQRMVYNSITNKSQLINTDAKLWAMWKDGKLVFRDEPLDIVFKKLGRAFNVDIAIKSPSISHQPYRATFEGESLDEILRLLKMTIPVSYVRSERTKQKDGSYKKEKIDVYMTK